ncbi:RING-H2 finger protein ATL18 [Morella rubra]|uniref:RING-H2 finger protein ATL18 n=1 Tax=Morella rubra TaxID=262757 RepID=A0A6A1V4H3_9ROSI|nr:RING-H2 finger protein ATL18 [Morella rubra]
MNCLVVSQSRLCMATIIFYTCIWIPFQRLMRALLGILGLLFFTSHDEPAESCNETYLPVARFEDLQSHSSRENTNNNVDGMCSICLVEFEKEDIVSQLSRCGHVFHMNCIERWLDRNQFTCPLCRSFFFCNVNTNCHANCGATISRSPSSYQLDSSWH